MHRIAVLIGTALLLGACANQGLVQVRSNSPGPDEFMVDPKKELTMPANFSQLPPPTPGQSNRTDVDAQADMVVAMGGRPKSADGPIPAGDGALVNATSRFGVQPTIRTELATEDAEFRRKRGRLTQFRIFPANLYADVYRPQALDPRDTAEAWQRAGARTPNAPPE